MFLDMTVLYLEKIGTRYLMRNKTLQSTGYYEENEDCIKLINPETKTFIVFFKEVERLVSKTGDVAYEVIDGVVYF